MEGNAPNLETVETTNSRLAGQSTARSIGPRSVMGDPCRRGTDRPRQPDGSATTFVSPSAGANEPAVRFGGGKAMSKEAMDDLVVLLPGITGSVLQRDGRDVWNLSARTIWSTVVSRGDSIRSLRLDGDDPTAAVAPDGSCGRTWQE
jgi:hypothetical protein